MANKQDSNSTGLSIAEESAVIGVLPASPVWYPYSPNSYSDFGGQTTTLARNPINQSRQRQKGNLIDLEAAGGFNQDFLQNGLRDILQGFMWANWREQPNDTGPLVGGAAGVTFTPIQYTASDGSPDLLFTAGAPHGLATGDGPFHFVEGSGTLPGNITEDTEYWIVMLNATTFNVAVSYANAVATVPVVVAYSSVGVDDATRLLLRRVSVAGTGELYYVNDAVPGFQAGALAFASGFTNAANNGLKNVDSVAAGVIGVDEDVVDEAVSPATAKLEVVGFVGVAGDIDVDAAGAVNAYTSSSLDFETLGLVPGSWIYVGGDAAGTFFPVNTANNGWKRVFSVDTNRLEVDHGGEDMVTEADAASTIHIYLSETLKNEADFDLQVRRTYQLERTLGNDGNGVQSEIEIGSVPSSFQFNVPGQDKVNIDLSFLATDEETRTGTVGVKAGERPDLVNETFFNTSSNIVRLKMTRETTGLPLFAYVTEFNVALNNSLAYNKAVSVLGAFDVTAGQFVVSGSVTAYFADVAAKAAMRANEDVSLDWAMVQNNAGWVVDVPLITLGDGRNNVEQDAPITLPLTLDAGAHGTFDHTLLLARFPYLPDAAA
jgi:hypothetical protein